VRVSGPIVTSAIQVLRLAAARGLGIASGPILFFRDDIDAGRVVRVLPTWELPVASIYAFYPVGRRPSPKVAAFNAFMQRFFDGRFL
jgi:DNA-binding transcriptional LysR family regulator